MPRRKQLYPEKRWVAESTILGWARDLEADGDIEGGFGDGPEAVDEAIRQLEDLGVATFAEVSRVPAHGNENKPGN